VANATANALGFVNYFSNDFAQKKLHKKAGYSGCRLSLLVFLHKSSLKGNTVCVQSPQGYAHFLGRLPRRFFFQLKIKKSET